MATKTSDQDKEVETAIGGWELGSVLGEGSSGSVYMATLTEPRSERFKNFPEFMAVKSSWGSSWRAELEREKFMLESFSDCPEVIRYLGSEETPLAHHLFIELATGGTLGRLVDAAPVDERLVRRHVASVLRGLERIHGEGFVHCDIKPENILLVAGDGGYAAKVADFGMAKRAMRIGDVCSRKRSLRGTMVYLPPEAAMFFVQQQPSDVWALGCVALELLGGKLPWQYGDLSNDQIRNMIATTNPVLPTGISSRAKDFLERCFVINPGKRATAAELLNHPFLGGTGGEEEDFACADDDGYDFSKSLMVSDEKEHWRGCSSSAALKAFGKILCSFFS